MDSLANEILALIKTNPGWAVFVIGLTAFGESFAISSLFFPGTTILIASGALISEGVLGPFLPVLAGIVGAVLGDAISFLNRAKIRTSSSDTLAVPNQSGATQARHSFFR
jgi:membrane protein DedA with SNARE-associated domain